MAAPSGVINVVMRARRFSIRSGQACLDLGGRKSKTLFFGAPMDLSVVALAYREECANMFLLVVVIISSAVS